MGIMLGQLLKKNYNAVHKLNELLRRTVASGLLRTSITKASEWAERYRIMGKPFPGPWTFIHHPWLREMHDAEEPEIIGQKAAQMGFTEVALNRVFKAIDIDNDNVLYVLPNTHPDVSDFSASRLDPAIELSKHLRLLFTDVSNIGHKRAGAANLFLRGSKSKAQLRSIPASNVIVDELDVMDQANVSMIPERMSGQLKKSIFYLSTPTIDKIGINALFNNSTQDHYCFKCPHCSRWIELSWPDSFIVVGDNQLDPRIKESKIICKECKQTLSHDAKRSFLADGKWISSYSDRYSRGFYINQLYSTTVSPTELALAFLKAQENPTDEQEFYNQKVGIPHVVQGARLTDEIIKQNISNYKKVERAADGSVVTMGVDVGKWLHYEITQWFFDATKSNDINLAAKGRVLMEGKIEHFEELDRLMYAYNVLFCVIDAQPERRKAFEFASRYYGRAKICFYGNSNVGSKQIQVHNDDDCAITVDRTSWLDLSLGRLKRGMLQLPVDVSEEYKRHLKALVRIYEKDQNGNPVGRYEQGNEDDHFAHARNYCEIALSLGTSSLVSATNVNNVY